MEIEPLFRSDHLHWRGASFDFAQDEDEFDVPSIIYLILSVVEGRMARVQICACLVRKRGPRRAAGGSGPPLSRGDVLIPITRHPGTAGAVLVFFVDGPGNPSHVQ